MKIKTALWSTAAVTAVMGAALLMGGRKSTAACSLSVTPSNLYFSLESRYSSSLSSSQLEALEDYVVGVVAAEMPASYGDEALKAQAVASRTYALRALEENPNLDYSQIGQAYITTEEMSKRWGEGFNAYYSKIRRAVSSTRGVIRVYNGEPILAAFCASSSGATEASAGVWGCSLPYLVAVDSHWDSNITETRSYGQSELISILGGIPEIQSRTPSGCVNTVCVSGNMLTGREIRSALGLKSANFQISRSGDRVYITTKGSGHGVGMSQTGAGAMAEEGSSFEEILSHYYPNTENASIS